jgi:hypothetical protein
MKSNPVDNRQHYQRLRWKLVERLANHGPMAEVSVKKHKTVLEVFEERLRLQTLVTPRGRHWDYTRRYKILEGSLPCCFVSSPQRDLVSPGLTK